MTQADRTSQDRPLRRRRRSFGLAAAALGATLVGSALAPAEAQAGGVPRVLRPGTRPMQFLFGVGPSWGIGGAGYYYGPGYYGPGCGGLPGCHYGAFGYWGAFKLMQEFNGHFSGNASGPALGILLNQEFGYGRFGFVVAPKFTYDIQPKKDLGLYISPNVSFGYQLLSSRAYYSSFYDTYYRYAYHGANLQFGVGLKLMLDDRWIVWLQFPHFDMTFGPGYGYGCGAPGYYCPAFFVTRLNLMVGGGVSF